MKAYTNMRQSQMLAGILPTKSADMSYSIIRNIGQEPYHCSIPIFSPPMNGDIPCWSISALFTVIPQPLLHKTFTGWRCDSYNKEGTSCILGESSDNPVDACVEMILKLKERSLI